MQEAAQQTGVATNRAHQLSSRLTDNVEQCGKGYRRWSRMAGKAQGFVVPVILFSRLLVHAVKQMSYCATGKVCGCLTDLLLSPKAIYPTIITIGSSLVGL